MWLVLKGLAPPAGAYMSHPLSSLFLLERIFSKFKNILLL